MAPSRYGTHDSIYKRNKKKILMTQDVCALCGKPVDKSLKYPDKWCATVDHIIPLNKGGHPSALDNLQLAHFYCNRIKSDNVGGKIKNDLKVEAVGNRQLPLTRDWSAY